MWKTLDMYGGNTNQLWRFGMLVGGCSWNSKLYISGICLRRRRPPASSLRRCSMHVICSSMSECYDWNIALACMLSGFVLHDSSLFWVGHVFGGTGVSAIGAKVQICTATCVVCMQLSCDALFWEHTCDRFRNSMSEVYYFLDWQGFLPNWQGPRPCEKVLCHILDTYMWHIYFGIV